MNPKYQKVLSDIEKAEKKKSEIEGQLKELYDKKTELENLEIINSSSKISCDSAGGTLPALRTSYPDVRNCNTDKWRYRHVE